MDVVANDLFVSALTGHVAAMASEEEETAIAGAANRKYEIAFDPLDGSSNLDTNLPTGSIFCIFEHTHRSRVKVPPWPCPSSAPVPPQLGTCTSSARLLYLLSVRLVALVSSALPECVPRVKPGHTLGAPATASAAYRLLDGHSYSRLSLHAVVSTKPTILLPAFDRPLHILSRRTTAPTEWRSR